MFAAELRRYRGLWYRTFPLDIGPAIGEIPADHKRVMIAVNMANVALLENELISLCFSSKGTSEFATFNQYTQWPFKLHISEWGQIVTQPIYLTSNAAAGNNMQITEVICDDFYQRAYNVHGRY
jgi:hypothetical protein